MAEQTELDKWEPRGIPIHPFDMYELLLNSESSPTNAGLGEWHPPAADEDDYTRNIHKLGAIKTVNGVEYFVTTNVDYNSDRFAEYRRQA